MTPFDEYYWRLKYLFPSDPDFFRENYWELPFEYVINAIYAVERLRKIELHENERPMALMMLQQAEMNRDPKKTRKPHTLDQFCLYATQEDKNIPAARYGAAAMALIELGKFPGWGLFVYQDLKKNATNAMAPSVLAYICDDAVVLAPELSEKGLKGMLVAKISASRQARTLENERGDQVRVVMPAFNSSFFADEEALFDVLNVNTRIT